MSKETRGQRPRVLVVEDDEALGMGLVRNLEFEGYETRLAPSGEEALRAWNEFRPDLIVLDLMLPDMDGVEVLQAIRGEDPAVHVLILSALGEEQHRVRGLKAGADDYVGKPFSLEELLARVEAGIRKKEALSGNDRPVTFGQVEVHRESRRVLVRGREVRLTRREFQLLELFLENPGRVLTREKILRRIWGWDYEGTARTVDNFVRSLRAKLEEDPSRPRHFLTVRGEGYAFEPVATPPSE